ncbi:hypothetical protein JCM5350_000679 [Sporobolomyces pararoseus]
MSSSLEPLEPTYLTLRYPHKPSPTFVKRWSSEGGTVEIGRAPKDKVKEAQDPTTPFFRSDKTKVMSSSHARVLWKKGVPHLSDSGSTNGTFVNDQPLKPGDSHEIVTGDRITFGRLVTSRHDGETGQPLILVAEVSNYFESSSPPPTSSSVSSSASSSVSGWRETLEISRSPGVKRENQNQGEDDLIVIGELWSDRESEDGPACTLAATQFLKKKKSGYGVPTEDESVSSSGEEEEDMKLEDVPVVERPRSYRDSIEPEDQAAEKTFIRDNSDARSPFSSRLPSPVSPDQVRSSSRTTAAALDLSISGFLDKDFSNSDKTSDSQTGIYFSQRILEDNRRNYFARRSDSSDHSASSTSSDPSFQVSILSKSSSTSSLVVEKKKEEEKEEDAFSQASQLPSPQLSACSSVDIDITDVAQQSDDVSALEEDEAQIAAQGEGSAISVAEEESEVEENQAGNFSPILADNNDRPISSQFKKLDEVIERLSKKVEEEERLAQEKKEKVIEAEVKESGSVVDEDDSAAVDAWLDSLNDEERRVEEEKDECDFDGVDPPAHGITPGDLEATPLVDNNLFDSELERDGLEEPERDGFEEPDQPFGFADPDVDSYLFEVDLVIGGDPDYDNADPDGWDNDIDADMAILKAEEELQVKADQPVKVEEPHFPQDSPHLAYAGHLLAMFDEKPSDTGENATFTPSSSLTSVNQQGKKRRLSDTDFDQVEEAEEKKQLVAEDTPARVFASQPKRRRIAAHVATFAVGLLTGVVGAIAGLSALGAALEDEVH